MAELATSAFAKVASGIYLEGPAVDHARGTVWYSDVIAGGIHGVKPDGSKVGSCNPGRMWTGGVMLNHDGAVLSTGEGGIMWNDPATELSGRLLDLLAGEPINGINEMVPDGNLLDRVETPAGSITQLRFGGSDMRDLYFISVPVDGGDTLKEGGEMTERNSFLFGGRSAVPGLPIAPARLDLT